MSTFARLDNTGTVVELLVADALPPFAPGLTWMDITSVSPQPAEGWAYSGGTWSPGITQASPETLTEVAHDAAFAYVDQYFDSSGLVRMAIWLSAPTTPVAGIQALQQVLAWADNVWALYLGVYKPAIAAGGNPTLDYGSCGAPPYSFTQLAGMCATQG